MTHGLVVLVQIELALRLVGHPTLAGAVPDAIVRAGVLTRGLSVQLEGKRCLELAQRRLNFLVILRANKP